MGEGRGGEDGGGGGGGRGKRKEELLVYLALEPTTTADGFWCLPVFDVCDNVQAGVWERTYFSCGPPSSCPPLPCHLLCPLSLHLLHQLFHQLRRHHLCHRLFKHAQFRETCATHFACTQYPWITNTRTAHVESFQQLHLHKHCRRHKCWLFVANVWTYSNLVDANGCVCRWWAW